MNNGFYTIELYCANDACQRYKKPAGCWPVTFIGQSLAACLQDASSAGWIVTKNLKLAFCCDDCKTQAKAEKQRKKK